MVIGLTGFVMFFLAGANLVHVASMVVLAFGALVAVGLRGYQLDRIQAWLNPWAYPDTIGFHTIQGLLALGLGGVLGAGLGESRLAGGLFLPNASNDYIFAIIGEEFGLVGGAIVIGLFAVLAYSGIRVALAAPDTFGALLAAGITGWLCIQAFINIGVVVTLIPVTGVTLPFISAGGSSLTISLAAVGVLLSISRETVERGTWNDATADRGRRHGRAHLPSPRRGSLAGRSTERG
jgi:cell division protein FtsW